MAMYRGLVKALDSRREPVPGIASNHAIRDPSKERMINTYRCYLLRLPHTRPLISFVRSMYEFASLIASVYVCELYVFSEQLRLLYGESLRFISTLYSSCKHGLALLSCFSAIAEVSSLACLYVC